MNDTAVLFANEAFYAAFAAADFDQMCSVWCDDHPITCLHPGWQALTDRQAVLSSWRDILSSADRHDITCRDAQVFQHGDLAYVLCYEVLGNSVMAATNIFRQQGAVWKMIHHQAAPSRASPSAAPTGPSSPLQ